jgi:hypothetical protein
MFEALQDVPLLDDRGIFRQFPYGVPHRLAHSSFRTVHFLLQILPLPSPLDPSLPL